jgi:hypothetical protein
MTAKLHFVIKRKVGEDEEILGKITSIGLHFVEERKPSKGLVRLTSLKNDTFKRLKNNQIVLTSDGLGFIKDYSEKKGEDHRVILPVGVNVRVRNLKKEKIYYNLSNLKVIDIIDNKTGNKYPAIERDYPLLVIDDMPVEFIVNKYGHAVLSLSYRKKLKVVKIFTKKSTGLQLMNTMIEKGMLNI